ncbi:MAG TPA: hypothetical protein VJ995_08440 [Geothermobacteraceae bacterium]|nr:hypothetical protein [Geothermobacteraceae bacterium]
MRIVFALVLVLLFGQSSVFAEELTLKIFFTDSPDKLEEALATSVDHTPTIETPRKIKRNQLVHAGFAVSGFKINSEHRLCLDLDVKVIDPNGKLVLAKEPLIKDHRVISQENGQLILDGLLDFLIEDGDPSGIYQLGARLIDGNKSAYALDSYKIIIDDGVSPQPETR